MNTEEETKIQAGIDFWLNGFKSPLRFCVKELEKMLKIYQDDEGDHRTGEETYGYADDEDNENNMMYISDRWKCAFRVRWLLDGIKAGKL